MTVIGKIKSDQDIIDTVESLLNQGNTNKAHKICAELHKLYNKNFYLNFYLAKIAFLNKQFDVCLQYLNIACASGCGNAGFIVEMGHMFFSMSKYGTARACFGRANEIYPKNYQILYNLASSYKGEGENDVALKYYKEAKAVNNTVQVNNKIGLIYYLLQNTEKSLHYFEEAQKLDPNDLDVLIGFAKVYQATREKDKAIEYCQKVISIDKHKYYAYNILCELKKFDKKNDDDVGLLNKIISLSKDINIETSNLVIIYFTIGKIYNDLKEYSKAFEYFKKANSLKSQQISYDKKPINNVVKNSKKVFSNDFVLNKPDVKCCNTCSIFIVGMPRSGTTLTEQIVSLHSKVTGIGESSNVFNLVNELGNLKQTIYPDFINLLDDSEIQSIPNLYNEILQKQNIQTHFIVDKKPTNAFYIGFISCFLNNSVIINCKRHPLDILLSIYSINFQDSQMLFSYKIEDIVHFYKCYDEMMKYWKSIFPDKIYDSYYENLVLNQEVASKGIIKNCDLEWEDSCLNFNKSKNAIFTASSNQVQNKLYTSSMFRWKKYEKHLEKAKELLADEIAEYEAELDKILS